MMQSEFFYGLMLGLAILSQVNCGGPSDSATGDGSRLKKRTVLNGKDQLLQIEEYFYNSDSSDPSRIEVLEPNDKGKQVVVTMKEFNLTAKQHEVLEVTFDPNTSAELRRETTREMLEKREQDYLVMKKVTEVEEGNTTSTEVVTYEYTDANGKPYLKLQKTVLNNVPIRVEEWDYDEMGRVVEERVSDGDNNLLRTANYSWKEGTFAEDVFNAAGQVTEEVEGKAEFKFGRVIRMEEERVGQVLVIQKSCKLSGRKLACSEDTSDRISSKKKESKEMEVVIDGQEDIDRPLELKQQRYEDENPILVVVDDWKYRSDRQVKLQIHSIEAEDPSAIDQFKDEFEELFDYRLAKDYNANAQPVREHKQTDDPLTERLISYEY